jgi:hypothetical protein
MNRRHEAELQALLEQVADYGYVEINREKLLRWYEQDRTSPTIWRDIEARWDELEKRKLRAKAKLGVWYEYSDRILLVTMGVMPAGAGKKGSERFKPISEWTE